MKISLALLSAVVYSGTVPRDADGNCPDDTWAYDGECYTELPARPAPRSGGATVSDEERSERRYADLKEMASKIFAKAGYRGKSKFDERKYWAYGCHCMLLGDRPMSEMGQGSPRDPLDNKCKAWKDCQKCVREKHGNDCIGEMIKYPKSYSSKKQEWVTVAKAGTCRRELFECDLQFAKDTLSVRDVWNEQYHAFSTFGFDNRDEDNCPKGGSAPIEHQCCGGHDRIYHWIGLNQKQCCADGQSGIVKDASEQC